VLVTSGVVTTCRSATGQGLRNQRGGTEHKFAVHRRSAVAIACIVTFVVLTPPIQTSAQPSKIGSVYDVTGVGTVTRQAAESRPLAVTDDVIVEDTITSGSQSHVRIGFAAGALAELGEHSVMTIAEEAGRPVLNLDNGVVYYRVSREGERRDEAQAVLTPNAIARTTGSLWVKVDRASDTVLVTTVCVLKGNGSAATLDGAKVEVPERNCVTVSGGVLGTVSPLPPQTPIPIPYRDLPYVARP